MSKHILTSHISKKLQNESSLHYIKQEIESYVINTVKIRQIERKKVRRIPANQLHHEAKNKKNKKIYKNRIPVVFDKLTN